LVMVICARIIEEIKGIINFVDSLGSVRLRKIQLVIAGDGPDRERLEAYIKEHFLSNDVMLVGDVQPARLREILASANLFCLPSFTDASPLAVVEALRMELPLLISNRCGNHYEAVCEGVNGYTFNPEDRRSVTKAFDSLPLSASDLNEMGQQSRKIYERTFRLDKVSERIANHFRLR